MNLNKILKETPSKPFGDDFFDYMADVETYAEKEYKTDLSYLMHISEMKLNEFNKKFIEGVSPYVLVDDIMFEEKSHKSRAYSISLLQKSYTN